MAKAKYPDLPQYVGFSATEGAANGGVITQFPTSLTTRDAVGVLIHRVEFLTSDEITGGCPHAANGRGYFVGLTQLYNAGSVPTYNDPGVLAWRIKSCMYLSAVDFKIHESPMVLDFTDDPLLAHPAALYWFFKGVGQAAALTMSVRLKYSYRDLTSNEYQDILQTIVLQNAL